jgi:hypothetical protein
MKKQILSISIIGLLLFAASCSEDITEPKNNNGTVETKTIWDLPADVSAKPGDPASFTFFSFVTGDTVTSATANADNWDIAFSQTTIKTNEKCKALVLEQTDFASLLEAPATGYNSSSKIPWYAYNSETHQISPTPGVVLLFQTSNNKYAKMLVVNYYKGHPAEYTAEAISRYYSFKYAYQPDGSRKF